MEKALETKDAEVAQAQRSYEAAAAKLQEHRAALADCEQGIAALRAERVQLSSALGAAGAERKKLENRCVIWLSTQSDSYCTAVHW
jgi:chromosome segregation ATPase